VSSDVSQTKFAGHRFQAFNFIEANTRLYDHINLMCRTAPDGPYENLS
jgi:hypothetical protein